MSYGVRTSPMCSRMHQIKHQRRRVLFYVHRNRRLIRDGHLDFHTAPELCIKDVDLSSFLLLKKQKPAAKDRNRNNPNVRSSSNSMCTFCTVLRSYVISNLTTYLLSFSGACRSRGNAVHAYLQERQPRYQTLLPVQDRRSERPL